MAALTPRAIPVTRRVSALYCVTHGSGTPLLLIHGIGETGTCFQPLIPTLAARYHVIVPDLRGHGHSQRLPNPDSIARLAADIENLLDLLRVPACFVIGHAAGSAVALHLAHEHPARVRGLVLACAYARSATTLREQLASRLRFSAGLRSHARPDRGGDARAACSARTALPFDGRPWLPALACPTLVVAGSVDRATPLHHARELARLLPDATLHVIPGADHRLITTHPDQLLAVALPWLAEREVPVC